MHNTLVEMLDYSVKRSSGPFFYFFDDPGEERSLEEIWLGALRWATQLRAEGVGEGDLVAIAMHSVPRTLEAFFGTLMRRAAVVPLPPFGGAIVNNRVKQRYAAALSSTRPRVLIGSKKDCQIVHEFAPSDLELAIMNESTKDIDESALMDGTADDLAIVQLTSGSTHVPRGVSLQNKNVLSNIENSVNALELTNADRTVAWLPLHHDMGLIGMILTMLRASAKTMIMRPITFFLRPLRWLEAMTLFRGTFSVAPNFGYQVCVDKISDEKLENLDLSLWTRALNGAEPVRAGTIEAFCKRFEMVGFRKEAMVPVYGLAESTLAVAFPPLGRSPYMEEIDPELIRSSGIAQPKRNGRKMISVGRVFKDCQLEIIDPVSGKSLPERHEGEIAVRGPSVMTGYFNDASSTAAVLKNGWLYTGDSGYIADGELFITGRLKDIIIRSGEKYHAEDLERTAEKVAGTIKGCTAAFAIDRDDSEKVTIVLEFRSVPGLAPEEVAIGVADAVERYEGIRPDQVVVVAPRSIPKTTSGKIQRAECRSLLEQGKLRIKYKHFS